MEIEKYIEITSKSRKVKEMYVRCGYSMELNEESRFKFTKEFTRDDRLVYTHYIDSRVLFTEYFDTEKKLWVYKTLDN